MEQFFGNNVENDETSATLKSLNSEMLTERKANVFYGLCLDKGLQVGIGVSTSMFVPKTILLPLTQNEERVRKEFDSDVMGRCERSVILDIKTGELISDI